MATSPKRKRASAPASSPSDDATPAGSSDAPRDRSRRRDGRVVACPKCLGEGRTRASRSRKARARYKRAAESAAAAGLPEPPPPPPRTEPCGACSGSGLVLRPGGDDDDDGEESGGVGIPGVDPNARVAVVGGGIGGFALALALRHRGVPCDVYERDVSFDERSQGYGLTMQQGARAIKSLALAMRQPGDGTERGEEKEDEEAGGGFGIHSKRHVVHRPDGTAVGQWGMKVWGRPETKAKQASRQNAHIARQELRRMLLERLRPGTVKWGHQLVDYRELAPQANEGENGSELKDSGKEIEMTFVRCDAQGTKEKVTRQASVLVGADGIRSAVRLQKIGEAMSPLKYLGCIVILGIAQSPKSSLTDGETVFQTADGTTRIYSMPFAKPGEETAGAANLIDATSDDADMNDCETSRGRRGETMWQLSFPMDEAAAKELSQRGPAALKDEALARCGKWHDPIPELLKTTPDALVSGYPVYDRDLLSQDLLRCGQAQGRRAIESTKSSQVTLIGDAAHPMSPFKGQGANQALLDAVLLARALYKAFRVADEADGRRKDNRLTVADALADFEGSMLDRSAAKVKASAAAAEFLHSDVAIMEGNFPRCTAANAVPSSKT